MKQFWTYTGLRLALLIGCYAVIAGAWWVIGGAESLRNSGAFISLLAAALISSLLSLKLLARQRDAFAARVQERATRATQKFEELRSAEDSDES